MPNGGEIETDFTHASDLIAYIKSRSDVCIGGACYPEGHPESYNKNDDLKGLKAFFVPVISHFGAGMIDRIGKLVLLARPPWQDKIVYHFAAFIVVAQPIRRLHHSDDVTVIGKIRDLFHFCKLHDTSPFLFRAASAVSSFLTAVFFVSFVFLSPAPASEGSGSSIL